jgi:hypothetical protein
MPLWWQWRQAQLVRSGQITGRDEAAVTRANCHDVRVSSGAIPIGTFRIDEPFRALEQCNQTSRRPAKMRFGAHR